MRGRKKLGEIGDTETKADREKPFVLDVKRTPLLGVELAMPRI